MNVTIYDINGNAIISGAMQAVRNETLNGERSIEVTFHTVGVIEIPASSYINFDKTDTQDAPTDRWYLADDYRPLESQDGFAYTLNFQHFSSYFQKSEFYFQDVQGLKQFEWTLSADLETAAALIEKSIHRDFPEFGVTLNLVEGGADLTDLFFNNMSILGAAEYIAEQFGVEMWFDGAELNFGTAVINTETPHVLEHLINIEDEISVEYSTRPQFIRALGGKTNMPVTAEGAITYQGRLPMPEGRDLLEVEGVNTGLFETVINDNIYPTFASKVTKVEHNGSTSNPIYFIYSDLGVKLSSIIDASGNPVVLRFTDGPLAGREFDVQDSVDNKIEIIRVESNGVFIPRPFLAPTAGNNFLLKNVVIGQTQMADASLKLGIWVDEHIAEIERQTPNVQLATLATYYVENGKDFKLGESVTVKHPSLNGGQITSRVVGISFSYENPHRITLNIQDNLRESRLKKLEKELESLYGESGAISELAEMNRTLKTVTQNSENTALELEAVNDDTVFSLTEKSQFRDNFETICGVLVTLPLDPSNEDAQAAEIFNQAKLTEILLTPANKGTIRNLYLMSRGNADETEYLQARTTLASTYEVLRVFLENHKLYHAKTLHTEGFTKTGLVNSFTNYLNAETALMNIISKGNVGVGYADLKIGRQSWALIEWEALTNPSGDGASLTFTSTDTSGLKIGDLGYVKGDIWPNPAGSGAVARLPMYHGSITLKIESLNGLEISGSLYLAERFEIPSVTPEGNMVIGEIDTGVSLKGPTGSTFRPVYNESTGLFSFEESEDVSPVITPIVSESYVGKELLNLNAASTNRLRWTEFTQGETIRMPHLNYFPSYQTLSVDANGVLVVSKQTESQQFRLHLTNVTLRGGVDYVFSFEQYGFIDALDGVLWGGNSQTLTHLKEEDVSIGEVEGKRHIYSIKLDTTETAYLQLSTSSVSEQLFTSIGFYNFMLAEGNTASAWSASPLDVEDSLEGVRTIAEAALPKSEFGDALVANTDFTKEVLNIPLNINDGNIVSYLLGGSVDCEKAGGKKFMVSYTSASWIVFRGINIKETEIVNNRTSAVTLHRTPAHSSFVNVDSDTYTVGNVSIPAGYSCTIKLYHFGVAPSCSELWGANPIFIKLEQLVTCN